MRTLTFAAPLAGLVACSTPPEDAPAATPQRPSFSSDTNTAARGSVEMETGAQVDPNDALSLPTSFRYGAGDATEVYVGLSPYEVVERPGDDGEGFGDTTVGVRHRFFTREDGTSGALQVQAKLPTGEESEGLSSGEVDGFGAAILTHVFDGGAGTTLFYQLGLLGDPDGSGTDTEHALAFAASAPLPHGFGVFAELLGIDGPDDDPASLQAGFTRSVLPSLVFDVSAIVGLNSDADDAVYLAGLTMNLGRLHE